MKKIVVSSRQQECVQSTLLDRQQEWICSFQHETRVGGCKDTLASSFYQLPFTLIMFTFYIDNVYLLH